MGEMRNAYNMLVGKLEWERPLGKPRRRWEKIRAGRCGLDTFGSE
jgi:hypothetical protein